MQAKYLASIILAVLAISIGVLMYTLTTNVIQEFAKLLTPSQLNQMKLDVTIGSVYFLESTDDSIKERYIWLTINNRSPLKVIVKDITIINGTGVYHPELTEPTLENATINPGDILGIKIKFTWTSGEHYKIVIFVKAEGQSTSVEVKWEGTAPP